MDESSEAKLSHAGVATAFGGLSSLAQRVKSWGDFHGDFHWIYPLVI
jgi:hypothetical protein